LSPAARPSRALPSVPTRRSSDLGIKAAALEERPPKNLLDHVEAHLFWRDPPTAPPEGEEIRFQPCRDPQHELEWCAREIKRLCRDRKSTRLNSSHVKISYAVFCL